MLIKDDVLKKITLLSIPLILSALTYNVNSVLDTLMLGRANKNYLIAVGVAVQPIFIATVGFYALYVGSGVLISIAKGAGDRQRANNIFKQSLIIISIMAMLITTMTIGFEQHIIYFMAPNVDIEIGKLSRTYLIIVASGFIFLANFSLMIKGLIATGDTKAAMLISYARVGTNILLNYIMIYGKLGLPVMGVYGAAIATVCSDIIGLFLCMFILCNKKNFIFINIREKIKIDFSVIKEICLVGLPTAFERIFIRIGMLVTTIFVIKLGAVAIISNQILASIAHIPFLFSDAFSECSSTLSGFNTGNKNIKGLKTSIRYICIITILISVIFSILFYMFGKHIIKFYIEDEVVITVAYNILKIYVFIIPFQAVSSVLHGSLRGMKHTNLPAISMLFGVGLLRPVIAFFLVVECGMGLLGLWLSICIDEFARFVFISFVFRFIISKKTQLVSGFN